MSANEYHLDPIGIESVNSIARNVPRTVGYVRKLLGLLCFFRRYIKDLACLFMSFQIHLRNKIAVH